MFRKAFKVDKDEEEQNLTKTKSRINPIKLRKFLHQALRKDKTSEGGHLLKKRSSRGMVITNEMLTNVLQRMSLEQKNENNNHEKKNFVEMFSAENEEKTPKRQVRFIDDVYDEVVDAKTYIDSSVDYYNYSEVFSPEHKSLESSVDYDVVSGTSVDGISVGIYDEFATANQPIMTSTPSNAKCSLPHQREPNRTKSKSSWMPFNKTKSSEERRRILSESEDDAEDPDSIYHEI